MAARWRWPWFAIAVGACASVLSALYLNDHRTENRNPMPLPASNATAEPSLWQGRVTKMTVIDPTMCRCLVMPDTADARAESSGSGGIWFSIRIDSVIDRRTGARGELALGQRVSVWFRGPVKQSDPEQAVAPPDRVVIETNEVPPNHETR